MSDADASTPKPAPPFEPDVELIDNAEGNDRIRQSDRAAAEKYQKGAKSA